MATQSIVESVRRYLRAVNDAGFAVSFGVLFGSQARNTANDDSDIDLVVVSPKFDRVHSLSNRQKLWRIAAATDARIEPISCGEKQWREDSLSAILEIARREGQVIRI